NDWIGKARIRGGQVMGTTATLTPGSLGSDGNVEALVLMKLTTAHVPPEVARTLARELAGVWNAWAAGFHATIPGAYPTFAAFPGPIAPPTPAQPIALANASSAGDMGLKAAILAPRLTTALRAHANTIRGGSLDQAVKDLAGWIDGSFQEWKSHTMM